MTNIDRAADIIAQAMGEVACGYPSLPPEIAQTLADDGRLMPDLPEPSDPTVPEWECPLHEFTAVSIGSVTGDIRIWGDTSGYTHEQARWVAYALLAAANYAERNQK